MFTGIVTEVGTIRDLRKGAASAVLTVETQRLGAEVRIGDSVAVKGVCLTVTSISGLVLSFDVVTETLGRTALGGVVRGDAVNLEGALRVGDRLSGHFVMGHVDGVGKVVRRAEEPGQLSLRFRAPDPVRPYLLEKGSIAVDGVSLTIFDVRDAEFSVAVVPHTQAETTVGDLRHGSKVNLEADVLARWVARLIPEGRGGGLTIEGLREAGWDA